MMSFPYKKESAFWNAMDPRLHGDDRLFIKMYNSNSNRRAGGTLTSSVPGQ